MDPAFSRRGEPATEFERALLSGSDVSTPTTIRQLWQMLAQVVGADRLFTVLDEFGDTVVWVPSRSGLINQLWIEVRNREIRCRRELHGESLASLARHFGMSRAGVARVVSPPNGNGPATRGIRGK